MSSILISVYSWSLNTWTRLLLMSFQLLFLVCGLLVWVNHRTRSFMSNIKRLSFTRQFSLQDLIHFPKKDITAYRYLFCFVFTDHSSWFRKKIQKKTKKRNTLRHFVKIASQHSAGAGNKIIQSYYYIAYLRHEATAFGTTKNVFETVNNNSVRF